MNDEFTFPEEKFILIGKVTKPHGLRGEVKILTYSAATETLPHYSKMTLVDRKGRVSPPLIVERLHCQNKVVILKFVGINDRNKAETLNDMGVLIEIQDLPETEEGEYYWFQLCNLPVFTEEGHKLGTITSIFSNGAQDIMVVQQSENEFLIPLLDTIIKEHTKEKVVVAPPPGLLEVNGGET